MDNRVYYGQYSLRHWLDLILKKNIILPDYQRYFVWNENKVTTLIETFRKKEFVPPMIEAKHLCVGLEDKALRQINTTRRVEIYLSKPGGHGLF